MKMERPPRKSECIYHPAVAQICTECTRKSCDGTPCRHFRDEYAKAMRMIRGGTVVSTKELYTYNGFTGTLAQWAERTGIAIETLKSRARYGFSVERMFTEKVHRNKV